MIKFHTHTVMPTTSHRPLVGKQTYRTSPSVWERGAYGWLLVRSTGYLVIELKTGKFQPEYAGKLNFYVALVDDLLRRGHHNETIGIFICGTKNGRSVRYSLGRSTSPMAVAAYTYDKLPRPSNKYFQMKDTSSHRWNGPNPMRMRKQALDKTETYIRCLRASRREGRPVGNRKYHDRTTTA